MTVHMTIALTEEHKANLDEIARLEALPVEHIASRIVQMALEERSSLAADVAEALADYAAGRFVDHETVVAESEARYRQSGDRAAE